MRKTLMRRYLSEEPGGACWAGVSRRTCGADAANFNGECAARSLPAFSTGEGCHSNFGEGGASGLPMQWEQHGSCDPDVPTTDPAVSLLASSAVGCSGACPRCPS